MLFSSFMQYTAEEAEWYGYNLLDATNRMQQILDAEKEAKIVPLKHELRLKLIEDLKSTGLANVERVVRTEQGKVVDLNADELVSPFCIQFVRFTVRFKCLISIFIVLFQEKIVDIEIKSIFKEIND